MTIPTIAGYAMPTSTDLPSNIASWTVDPRRAVLLIHDMQHYFLAPFERDVPPHRDLMRNVSALRTICAQWKIPIAYTAQPGDMSEPDRGLLLDFWGPGMSATPEHKGIPADIAPDAGDTVFTKWRASAFYRTGLLELLQRQGRDQLVLCGVYARVGILLTACEAFAHSIQPFVVADAVADFTAEHHRMALDYVAAQCAVVLTSSELLTTLSALGDFAT